MSILAFAFSSASMRLMPVGTEIAEETEEAEEAEETEEEETEEAEETEEDDEEELEDEVTLLEEEEDGGVELEELEDGVEEEEEDGAEELEEIEELEEEEEGGGVDDDDEEGVDDDELDAGAASVVSNRLEQSGSCGQSIFPSPSLSFRSKHSGNLDAKGSTGDRESAFSNRDSVGTVGTSNAYTSRSCSTNAT